MSQSLWKLSIFLFATETHNPQKNVPIFVFFLHWKKHIFTKQHATQFVLATHSKKRKKNIKMKIYLNSGSINNWDSTINSIWQSDVWIVIVAICIDYIQLIVKCYLWRLWIIHATISNNDNSLPFLFFLLIVLFCIFFVFVCST